MPRVTCGTVPVIILAAAIAGPVIAVAASRAVIAWTAPVDRMVAAGRKVVKEIVVGLGMVGVVTVVVVGSVRVDALHGSARYSTV